MQLLVPGPRRIGVARAALGLSLCVLLGCGSEGSAPSGHHADMRAREIASRTPDENPYTGSVGARRLRETGPSAHDMPPSAVKWSQDLGAAMKRAQVSGDMLLLYVAASADT